MIGGTLAHDSLGALVLGGALWSRRELYLPLYLTIDPVDTSLTLEDALTTLVVDDVGVYHGTWADAEWALAPWVAYTTTGKTLAVDEAKTRTLTLGD